VQALASAPRPLRLARIVTAIAASRIVGIALLLGWQNGTIPAYYAVTFAAGDFLVGLTALPLAYALGRGGIRAYGIAVAWCIVGLVDTAYAISIATQAGLFSAVSDLLGPGIVVLPIAVVIQLVVLALLLDGAVPRYMAREKA
jgi:hypothetical protein